MLQLTVLLWIAYVVEKQSSCYSFSWGNQALPLTAVQFQQDAELESRQDPILSEELSSPFLLH